ncbi:MAG: hypothetical protein MJ150_03865 [Clostridia bacterium]|nr:hypothetical protein [Clostridia bacterium]
MKSNNLRKTALTIILLLLVIASLGGAVTYAWFTYNSSVWTNRIEAKTSSPEVKLLLALKKEPFEGKDELNLAATQINEKGNIEKLMPVSTADLTKFVYNNGVEVEDEESIFHGVFYVMAQGNLQSDAQLALYFDDENCVIKADDDDSLFLNAGRLGLKFENADPVIIALSDKSNNKSDQIENTVLNGNLIPSGNVLKKTTSGAVTYVTDPAISFKDAGISDLSSEPFAMLDLNTVYQMDIFFYLEGTDPDCSDAVKEDAASVKLAFYGAVVE